MFKRICSILRCDEENILKFECIKICLIYAVVGFCWIYFSDRALNIFFSNSAGVIVILSTYKGCLYVIVTAIILYILICNLLKKVRLAEKKLTESNENLAASNEELQAYVEQLTASEEELRVKYDELNELELKLKYLSYHDQLTNLYNRRYFEEEIKSIDTEENYPLTIIMADVNGLKLVNDSFGHAVGDLFLKKIAEIMMEGCPQKGIIARLAGDEFVIMLPKTDSHEAKNIIKNIKVLASNEKIDSVDISISFGYETKNQKEIKIEETIKKAEDHMYKKKLFEGPSMRGKTISAIISTLHEKNKREEQHSHRVSLLCESMGRALGLIEDDIKELKNVGLLHDIGKIAIEENILNKEGKLTDSEWKEIKKHPEIGYRILSTVNDMSEMAEYVLAHHERWDGGGYPKGLKAKEIPLQSRIITIVDAYDAMVSERSYRDALPKEVAIEELKKNAGIQFDEELVKVFIEKVLNNKYI